VLALFDVLAWPERIEGVRIRVQSELFAFDQRFVEERRDLLSR
jgi:hypothetical protein